MAYEIKPNTGSLFANDRRESDTHPNAKGSAVIDGKEYWVDAWTNTASNGKKYQSLKFKLKDQQRAAQVGGGFATPQVDDLDDCPF
jgi:hypothetical protein